MVNYTTGHARHRWYHFALVALALLLLSSVASASEPRTALVIGNSDYAHFQRLENPRHDARDLSDALRDLGFSVTTLNDATHRQMFTAIRDFGERLATAGGVGLFYYAGHGIEVRGENFLIPVDADISAEDEIRFEATSADLILAKMESARSDTNIVILDACRDNPLPASRRGSARGLARMDAPAGSLVIHATAPGEAALDGDGRNGVFTGALLEHIHTPGLDVELMLRRVRRTVMDRTNGLQTPWTNSSLTVGFRFATGEPGPQRPDLRETDRPTEDAPPERDDTRPSISIGSRGPGGGVVFYDKGERSNGWRYLEAAEFDQSDAIRWNKATLFGAFRSLGRTDTEVGSGRSNTNAIVDEYGDRPYAARLCSEFSFNGYDDWFLPSLEELREMYRQRRYLDIYPNDYGMIFWSSSEQDGGRVWSIDFATGEAQARNAGSTFRVRAVRRF